MTEPTKADLKAAVAKLAEENAGLRDLIAAVSECAKSVPQAVYDDTNKQFDRARHTLIALEVVTDPESTWAWGHATGQAAAELREVAAEPVGYKVYTGPEPVITDTGRTCDQANPDSGAHCHRGGDHGVHRDANGDEWRTDGDPDRPHACCAHCIPGCDAKLNGHRIACTTPGCPSAQALASVTS